MMAKEKREKDRERIISFLSDLIAAKTENPPGAEYLAAEVVEKEFQRLNIRYEKFEKIKGRTNIVGHIGSGRPYFLIAAHLDVVPAGDGWTADPFKAVVKKDQIYGRGASDNKGPLASMLAAAEKLKTIETTFKGTILLAAVADEEVGSEYGMKFLINEKKIAPDFAIVPDTCVMMKKIDVGEKGNLFIQVTSHGKSAHGSTPDRGINAIDNLVDFLVELRKYKIPYKKSKLFTPPTMNVGKISGGTVPNAVPGKCFVEIDFRFLPETSSISIIDDIKKIILGIKSKNPKARFSMQIICQEEPTQVSMDNKLFLESERLVEEIVGEKPQPFGMSGATVIKFLLQKKIYALGIGPGKSGTAHAVDEYIGIEELIQFEDFVVEICKRMLS